MRSRNKGADLGPRRRPRCVDPPLLPVSQRCHSRSAGGYDGGGGPGNATTFLSIDLVKMALGQFDLGPAAAFSIMYFLVILLVSWAFYTVMTNLDREEGPQ